MYFMHITLFMYNCLFTCLWFLALFDCSRGCLRFASLIKNSEERKIYDFLIDMQRLVSIGHPCDPPQT